MVDLAQELMTPQEAAKWFRRSVSWLRRQSRLVKLSGPGGQPLFHVGVCRAYVLGQIAGAADAELRRLQLRALASVCGLSEADATAAVEGTRGLLPVGAKAPTA